MSQFTDEMTEDQARAVADVYRALIVRHEGGPGSVCSGLSQEHVKRMLGAFAQMTLEAMCWEEKALGRVEDEAWERAGARAREGLDEIELAMVSRGWQVYTGRITATPGEAPSG